MNSVLAYIPVIGWLYVFFFQRNNPAAIFHLKQGIGLALFLIASLLLWAVVAWIIAWIPYAAVLGITLFAIVMMAYIYGFVVWLMGMNNALHNRLVKLPFFGEWANRLPIQ
ncbi:MAG: hypothetical protein ABI690_30820 [Chloroflexota bacterium]